MKKTIVDNCAGHWTEFLLMSPICDFLGMYGFEPKELRRPNNLDTPHPL
jgi:hypothetical protein